MSKPDLGDAVNLAPLKGAVNRRHVLAATAWSIPVLAVSVATPLAAASPGPSTPGNDASDTLLFNSTNALGSDWTNVYGPSGEYVTNGPTTLVSQFTIQNVWEPTSVTLATVVVTVAYPDTIAIGGPVTFVVSGGWTSGGIAHDGSTWVYTLIWTGTLPAGGSTEYLEFKVPLQPIQSRPHGTFPVTFTASSSHSLDAHSDVTATL